VHGPSVKFGFFHLVPLEKYDGTGVTKGHALMFVNQAAKQK